MARRRLRHIILIIKDDRFIYSNELNDHHFFTGDPARFNPHTVAVSGKHFMVSDEEPQADYSLDDLLTVFKKQQKGGKS